MDTAAELNELLLHGRDITRPLGSGPASGAGAARGGQAHWPMPPEDAALFFDLFLVKVIHSGYGRLMDDTGPMPERRIAAEFRSRSGGGPQPAADSSADT